MSGLARVARRSVVDEAYGMLRARILHGDWSPGERLPTEHELTAALGVSRSTLREALNRLGSAGLISIPHGASKRVLDWRDHAGLEVLAALVESPGGGVNLETVRSVTELRAALAPDMVRLAALRRTDEQAQQIVAMAAALSVDDSLDELIVATLDWWTALVLSAGNLAYRLAYNTLRSTYREGRAVLQQVIADELRAVDRYRAVSAAVQAGDGARAETECRALIQLGTDALFLAIDSFSGGNP